MLFMANRQSRKYGATAERPAVISTPERVSTLKYVRWFNGQDFHLIFATTLHCHGSNSDNLRPLFGWRHGALPWKRAVSVAATSTSEAGRIFFSFPSSFPSFLYAQHVIVLSVCWLNQIEAICLCVYRQLKGFIWANFSLIRKVSISS